MSNIIFIFADKSLDIVLNDNFSSLKKRSRSLSSVESFTIENEQNIRKTKYTDNNTPYIIDTG